MYHCKGIFDMQFGGFHLQVHLHGSQYSLQLLPHLVGDEFKDKISVLVRHISCVCYEKRCVAKVGTF